MTHARSDSTSSASSAVSFDLPATTARRPPIIRRATPFPPPAPRSSPSVTISPVTSPDVDSPRSAAMNAWPAVLTSFPTLDKGDRK